jgi:hypothetical protein
LTPKADTAAAMGWYTSSMSSLHEQVVEDLRSLLGKEQDRAARMLLALLDGPQDDFRLMARFCWANCFLEAVWYTPTYDEIVGTSDYASPGFAGGDARLGRRRALHGDRARQYHDHYRLTDEQIEGVHHAMTQADRGEFATDRELKDIFGRSL